MRTAETMDAARRNMADAMTRLGDYLPEGAVKDDLMRRSRDILARAEAATKEQARLDRNPGQIEGDRFVEPEPRNVGALFTNEKKGTEIHYNRHDRESGAFQTLAFIDNGIQLDVRDWSNRESVNAALRLASQKWETLSVSGSDEYKEIVARLAAENGYKITNPELQDRIRELRAEIEGAACDRYRGEGEARGPRRRMRRWDPATPGRGPTSKARRSTWPQTRRQLSGPSSSTASASGSTPKLSEKPAKPRARGKPTRPTPRPAPKGRLTALRRGSPRGSRGGTGRRQQSLSGNPGRSSPKRSHPGPSIGAEARARSGRSRRAKTHRRRER